VSALSKFFIDRPIFAAVLSVVIMIASAIAVTTLPIVQVLVQNRVNLALPSLPDVVKQTGVSVKKRSPSILLVVNLFSPDISYDQLKLSNYATINLRDELAQLSGVGDISMFGQQDYSMRVWLDPEKIAARGLTAGDVVNSLREQNVQVAAGSLGRPPVPNGQAFQYTLSTPGRLQDQKQFGEIIVRSGFEGEIVRLRDLISEQRMDASGVQLGGIDLGAKNQDTRCYLDGKPSVGLSIYQQPGSNALATADKICERMEELKLSFPDGVDYGIVYDTTPFIDESIHEVFKALRDAIVLVGIVVLVFLQSWRATLIPLIAVPVAIVGTFALMAGFGFSLNNLSLLGLVLAIGIVVDDAIVVVEAVEHHLEHGMSPRDATRKAMDDVAVPVIAISLVLMAVFIPCAFITGITGQFFRQFAVTIAVSTFFSALNSLTLSPALAALLLRPKAEQKDILTRVLNFVIGWFFKLFNKFFDKASGGYAWSVGWLLRLSVIVLFIYGGLLYATYFSFTHVPTGFVPARDIAGPGLITRYNGVVAATINGGTLPGVSSGQMISTVDDLALKELPAGMTSLWTELTLLQIRAGNTAMVVFALAVVLVYLLLAAQYESLRLPFAVILGVPMCLLCSVIGVAWAGLDINIFVQIGLVVLVGLASKNAILIVEFAKEKRTAGASAFDATIEACRMRLRPILMTSFAFILGVVPLAIAHGAGAEMRRTLGIAVFSGMLGVTVFGIFLTPVFYFVLERLGSLLFGEPPKAPAAATEPIDHH